ncbi:MAG: hypothetical protein ISP49_00465 [Reyranella sp.]|nr:hypothetical protein [Reyranella sp.]MBL6650035.1 hypothetical protein [Reyranella sp.]
MIEEDEPQRQAAEQVEADVATGRDDGFHDHGLVIGIPDGWSRPWRGDQRSAPRISSTFSASISPRSGT